MRVEETDLKVERGRAFVDDRQGEHGAYCEEEDGAGRESPGERLFAAEDDELDCEEAATISGLSPWRGYKRDGAKAGGQGWSDDEPRPDRAETLAALRKSAPAYTTVNAHSIPMSQRQSHQPQRRRQQGH